MKNALQYARFEVFRRLLGPFSAGTRKARMAQLETVMGLKPGMRVMDLGGQPHIWNFIETPLDIVILNLPGIAMPAPPESIHTFKYVEGDACDVNQYGDNDFEFVFSNSVIEHVGGRGQTARLCERSEASCAAILGSNPVDLVSHRGPYGHAVLVCDAGLYARRLYSQLGEKASGLDGYGERHNGDFAPRHGRVLSRCGAPDGAEIRPAEILYFLQKLNFRSAAKPFPACPPPALGA